MASRTLLAALRSTRRISVPVRVRAPVTPFLAGIRWSSTGVEATSSALPAVSPLASGSGSTSAPTRITPSEGAPGAVQSSLRSSDDAPTGASESEPLETAAAETSAGPSTTPTPTPSAEPWTRAGIHPAVAQRLVEVYPQAVAPTPGQRAFLLTVMRGDTDVYLKDYMGRGKTFALALTALSLAVSGGGEQQVVMLLPTPHLAQQVSDLLVALAPEGKPLHTLVTEDYADWEAAVIVATPRVLNEANPPDLPHLSHILVDEPDTMLGPLPGRFLSPVALGKHPINKHPPPVVPALNRLLGISAPARKGKRNKNENAIDFGRRRTNIRTVWASATFGPAMRRFVYGRGWALGNKNSEGNSRGVVDLNFTAGSTEAQQGVVDTLRQIGDAGGIAALDPAVTPVPVPEHHALVVQPSGRMTPLVVDTTVGENMTHAERGAKDDKVALTVVEAMAFIHATSPPPPGTYALVLPPRSGGLNALADELAKLGIPVTPLIPEMLEGGMPPISEDEEMAPVLLSNRTAVAGLHLPQLHTVYLLNGLDMASLTPNQLKLGGRHDRETQYGVVAGRLGRMGTDAAHVPGHPQRVISLVAQGSYEEHALNELFTGRLNADNVAPHVLGHWEGDL